MKPKHFYPTILLLLLPVITGALLWPVSVSRAQGSEVFPEWRVYMKVAPCAGTLRDWMTVTDKQPVAGSNWYTPARDPVTGLTPPVHRFPQTPAGFAAAQVRANLLRIIGISPSTAETGQFADYDNYCCRDYSVLEKREPDGSVSFSVVRGSDNPGEGWVLHKSDLCCEHAAALAGFVGGGLCAFRLSTGQLVRFTGAGFVHVGAGPVTVEHIVIPPLYPMAGGFGGMEDNTNFTGSNIRFFGMNEGPESCGDACNQDGNCVAFTYVKKGAFDSNPDNAVCYLKSSVGERVSSTCCISGVKDTVGGVLTKGQPLSAQITGGGVSIGLKDSISLYSQVIGGVPPYTYQWTAPGWGPWNGYSVSYNFAQVNAQPGRMTVDLQVTDSQNQTTNAQTFVDLVGQGSTGGQIAESGIQVEAGTYGGNCSGVTRGNVTEHLAATCNGQMVCDYSVDHNVIGDPAYGCRKQYVAEWKCGQGSGIHRADAIIKPEDLGEAGYGSIVKLRCP